jgi:hypothetical protein
MEIKQLFSYLFPHSVLSIHYDSAYQVVIMEMQDTISTVFSVLSLQSLTFLRTDWLPQEDFNFAVAAVIDGKLVLQHFPQPNLPIAAGIFVWDIFTQALCWATHDYRFERISYQNIQATPTASPEDSVLLSLSTGNKLTEDALLLTHTIASPKAIHPQQYWQGTPHFVTVCTFLSNRFDIHPVEVLDYLEYKELVFISYFLPKNLPKSMGYSNYMLILDKQGEILWQNCINSNGKGITFDTFFVDNQKVIFLKDHHELIVLTF